MFRKSVRVPHSPLGEARLGQEAVAVEAEEDDAELDPDLASELDPDLAGVDSGLVLPLEPGSDLPLELDCSERDCSEPDWVELLARLSVR